MRLIVHDLVASVHERFLDERSGDILHGVPALEDVDPDSFGICLATADGYVYEVGDTRLPFCIQSISKPFTYGIALTDQGVEAVDAKIDVEPSGELFNEISLHPVTHRPRNPMINPGALVAASLVAIDRRRDRALRGRVAEPLRGAPAGGRGVRVRREPGARGRPERGRRRAQAPPRAALLRRR